MKRFWIIAGIAVCHFILSVVAMVQSFGMGMSRFDSGAPPSPLEQFVAGAHAVLSFPVLFIFMRLHGDWMRWFSGLAGYIPFVANSILWALCLYWVGAFVYKRTVEASHAYQSDAANRR